MNTCFYVLFPGDSTLFKSENIILKKEILLKGTVKTNQSYLGNSDIKENCYIKLDFLLLLAY